MNEYVQDTNQQQLEARDEIAEYVKMLEQQLREVKKNRPIFNKQGYSTQDKQQHRTNATTQTQGEPAKIEDLEDDCQNPSQVVELNQSGDVNFEDYLRCSSEIDDERDLKDVLRDIEPFPAELDEVFEAEEESFDYCFQSSAELVVQPDEVRMARVACIESFVAHIPEARMTNLRDSDVPVQRPARKTSSGKRRKLPQVTRKTSTRSTDSEISQSDETLSITSYESHVSRDTTDMRRVCRGGSGRRLPPVPSGEEIDLRVIEEDVCLNNPAVRQPPPVGSIYQKGPANPNNLRHDSGLGESIKNSPALTSKDHKFSISKLRRKFSKEKTGTYSL